MRRKLRVPVIILAVLAVPLEVTAGPMVFGDPLPTVSEPVRLSLDALRERPPLPLYDREAFLLLPRPVSKEQVYQHRWERIHPFHIPRLCGLRTRFLRAIHGRQDWYFRDKIFPFASLNRGRFFLGVEARESLLVEVDSRYAILARQVPGPRIYPRQESDRRIGLTFRWNLD